MTRGGDADGRRLAQASALALFVGSDGRSTSSPSCRGRTGAHSCSSLPRSRSASRSQSSSRGPVGRRAGAGCPSAAGVWKIQDPHISRAVASAAAGLGPGSANMTRESASERGLTWLYVAELSARAPVLSDRRTSAYAALPLFPTRTGGRLNPSNFRNRLLIGHAHRRRSVARAICTPAGTRVRNRLAAGVAAPGHRVERGCPGSGRSRTAACMGAAMRRAASDGGSLPAPRVIAAPTRVERTAGHPRS
jgi:hypothetical protein